MKRVCLVTTSPLIVNFFLTPHLLYLRERYDVSLAVTMPGEAPLRELPGIRVIPLEIRRKIEPWHDLVSLLRLYRFFRAERFDLVHSFSPKAGLLATCAGAAAGIPVRLHTFTGQVWVSRRGAMRTLLRATDRLTARMATHLLADSPSQRDFLILEGIVPPGKCRVLGHGSVSGVDVARFKSDPEARNAVRRELGIDERAVLVIYLGRINRDKGVFDLARAFGGLGERFANAVLLFVGPDEENLRGKILERCGPRAPQVRFAGYTAAPERYLAAADLLCLPSHREGFGSSLIEAAAIGLPAVASRIYGVVDAVSEGETGLLYAVGDSADLGAKLEQLLADEGLRRRLGTAAHARAETEFPQEALVRALADRYREILGA